MTVGFDVFGRISRPVAEVYEAVADPAKLSFYFTTGGAKGRLESGAVVMWDFADFPGAFPVKVSEARAPERIALHWAANDLHASQPYETDVVFRFEALPDGRTAVHISESGWQDTPSGRRASYGNCMGWSQMLCAMKAYLEHGIDLREGMYK